MDDEEIRVTVCDLDNQRVVRADAERTRGNDQLDKDMVELVLTKYCKNNNIKYKQGLNEVSQNSVSFYRSLLLLCFLCKKAKGLRIVV